MYSIPEQDMGIAKYFQVQQQKQYWRKETEIDLAIASGLFQPLTHRSLCFIVINNKNMQKL